MARTSACSDIGHGRPAAGDAELTRGSGVTQSAISQHLRSLKQAGLIADRPEGRNVHYRADPKGLAPLVDWMALYAVFWRERFANLRTLLKEIDP
jgi:DNA-binding transcriptional ArsR family regulator